MSSNSNLHYKMQKDYETNKNMLGSNHTKDFIFWCLQTAHPEYDDFCE